MAWNGPAVVLQTRIHGEADLAVTLFTRDIGKVRVIAKSAMKSKRRFVGQLVLFNHLDVTLAASRRSSMPRLDQSRLIESFPGVRKDINRVAAAACLYEMADIASAERDPSPRVYDILVKVLRDLDMGKDPDRVRLIYELKLISVLGFMPSLEICAHCGSRLGERSLAFSPEEGGLLCPRCSKEAAGAERISTAAVKSMRKALIMPDEKIHRLAFTKKTLVESLRVLSGFIAYHFNRPLKSQEFLIKQAEK